WKWRIGAVPGARVFIRLESALHGVGVSIAEGFIEAADAVVHRSDEHQVARRPCIEIAVRENTGHAELGHVRHVARADHLPLVYENGIDPSVVGAVADGVVVEIGNGFVQVVKYLRIPTDVRVQHVFGELEGDGHSVAIIVMAYVFAPIDEGWIKILRMPEVPFVEVDHAIAAIDFNNGGNQGDDAFTDFADVRALINGEAVSQLH